MEPTSSQADIATPRQLLEAQIRECYGRSVYTHTIHRKAAQTLLRRLGTVRLFQIILSALTTGGLIAAVAKLDARLAIGGTLASALLFALNLYVRDYDPGTLAEKHNQAAAQVWAVREAYMSLITDIRMGVDDLATLRKRRDDLQHRLHEVYEQAPSTDTKAYRDAQKALKYNEEHTFSPEEIDHFLPAQLQSTALFSPPGETEVHATIT